MADFPYSMVPRDLAGDAEARDRRRPRDLADRSILVHWMGENGEIVTSTQETMPKQLRGVDGLADADEVWWWPDGTISPWPPRTLQRGDKCLGDKRKVGDPRTD